MKSDIGEFPEPFKVRTGLMPSGSIVTPVRTNESGRKYYRRIPANSAGESDIHAICDAWDTPHSLAHAVKKILCAGMRGGKSREQDLREAIHAIEREMEFNAAHESRLVEALREEQMDHG